MCSIRKKPAAMIYLCPALDTLLLLVVVTAAQPCLSMNIGHCHQCLASTISQKFMGSKMKRLLLFISVSFFKQLAFAT